MDYWNDIITEKSWGLLQELRKKYSFIVIGGWAAWLWTKAHKSRDIDIVVDFSTLEKMRLQENLKKNDFLKKYEIVVEEIDVDIYVPFFSKLALPAEEIKSFERKVGGFSTVSPEALLVLKQAAELERKHSEKGLKDRVDILGLLLKTSFDYKKYKSVTKKYGHEKFPERLVQIVNSFREIEYLGLNPRQWKLKKQELLTKIKTSK